LQPFFTSTAKAGDVRRVPSATAGSPRLRRTAAEAWTIRSVNGTTTWSFDGRIATAR
jgi:hypothetical protein